VGAIFDRSHCKAKREDNAGEGGSNHSKKKKSRRRREGSLVAAVERKGKKAPTEGTPDHFEKMLEGPCPNHAYPVKHAMKSCGLMRKFLARAPRGRSKRRNPRPWWTRPRRRVTASTQRRMVVS
jgi:hypothetical protein